MKTKRLISTISYNTDGYLSAALERLVSAGLVDWAHWVRHQPEEDEEKSHVHLVVSPSRMIDTAALSAVFKEADLAHPDKPPLGVMPWRFCSSLDDWLLYAVHDPDYLLSKGQRRAYHYRREDVLSTAPDLLAEQWREINLARFGVGSQIAAMVQSGASWEQVICSGLVKPANWTFWREVYYSMRKTLPVVRKGPSHTPKGLLP